MIDVVLPTNDQEKDKQVRFRITKWREIRNYADELSLERGYPEALTMQGYISEAVKFFEENRKK